MRSKGLWGTIIRVLYLFFFIDGYFTSFFTLRKVSYGASLFNWGFTDLWIVRYPRLENRRFFYFFSFFSVSVFQQLQAWKLKGNDEDERKTR